MTRYWNWMQGQRRSRRGLTFLILSIALPLMILGSLNSNSIAQNLPEGKRYPLPDRLSSWQDASGDYFDQIDRLSVGALIWTRFPVQIFLDTANSKAPREATWLQAVRQAIQDWNQYLPVAETIDPKAANITIRRASVPIQRDKQGQLKPIRFAETRFEFYTESERLWHRMTILLSPNQADASLLAGARHELGHGLGIWGHSDRTDDVMYFSQVKQPPTISPRDVNTLKRIYSETTRLGGLISSPLE